MVRHRYGFHIAELKKSKKKQQQAVNGMYLCRIFFMKKNKTLYIFQKRYIYILVAKATIKSLHFK